MKELLFNYLDSCYLSKCKKYPNSIFYIHDIQLLREKKLNRIFGQLDSKNIITIKYKDLREKIILEQDNKNKKLWVNFLRLTLIFQDQYPIIQNPLRGYPYTNNQITCNIVSEWMEKNPKFNSYTIPELIIQSIYKMKKDTKFKLI